MNSITEEEPEENINTNSTILDSLFASSDSSSTDESQYSTAFQYGNFRPVHLLRKRENSMDSSSALLGSSTGVSLGGGQRNSNALLGTTTATVTDTNNSNDDNSDSDTGLSSNDDEDTNDGDTGVSDEPLPDSLASATSNSASSAGPGGSGSDDWGNESSYQADVQAMRSLGQ